MSKNKKVTVFCKYGVKHKDIFLKQNATTEITEELFKELKETWAYKRGVIKLVKKEIEEEKVDKK